MDDDVVARAIHQAHEELPRGHVVDRDIKTLLIASRRHLVRIELETWHQGATDFGWHRRRDAGFGGVDGGLHRCEILLARCWILTGAKHRDTGRERQAETALTDVSPPDV